MAQSSWMQATQVATPHKKSWVRVFFSGLALFIVTVVIMFATGNPNLYPTALLLGNFLIPVVFVTFLYDRQQLSALTLPTLAQSFLIGGVLGVLGASVLEPLLIHQSTADSDTLPLTSALLVGLIEEGCKIAAVLWLARKVRHTSEMDGLLTGAAIGMGFAALESIGYAFTVFALSGGHVVPSLLETIVRGLLAPFGHGIWTATLAAVLFRESTLTGFRFNVRVLLTFLFVALLHGLWDGVPRTMFIRIPPGFSISIVSLVLSVVGLVVLFFLYRQALHREMTRVASEA